MAQNNVTRLNPGRLKGEFSEKRFRTNRPSRTFKSPASGIGWPAFVAITVAMSLSLFLAIFFSGKLQSTAATRITSEPESASFGLCSGPVRRNCVVDGDTFWYAGRKIRIADINTPEISEPGCANEARLGQRARTRLHELLNQGSFTLAPISRDQDKYGRDLRIVKRGGKSLGDVLVTEGLADRWHGYRRDWC